MVDVDPPAGRAKRQRHKPSKFDASSGEFSEAEMQRAIKASVKLQRRTNSVAVPKCPTFRPTPDEFRDPFAYIKTITPEGQAAGIAKIIPPEGFKPTFDTTAGGDGIPFETKLQTINRLQEGLHFSDGERYNRDEYRKMADAFCEEYKLKHPALVTVIENARRDAMMRAEDAGDDISEATKQAQQQVMQQEFWRIVETNTENVRVEYGSDLDAAIYGSGFLSSDDHAWDFNELIHHPSNLLRVVGDDVPGLTRPWLYFGMLFSAFCWHVEDHYLGSINYLHAGSAKTWYGIPGKDADLFETAVKTTVPTLLDDKPDLLHRLVTLVPPGSLRDAHGVEVFQTTQNAGEFVVTWPRAYHAGFSHGFNVGEAVNFGTAEWVRAGRRAVEGYARGVGKRDAVFSHDRMVLDTARDFARRLKESEINQIPLAPWIKAVSSVLRDELAVIAKEQSDGRLMLTQRGCRVESLGETCSENASQDTSSDDVCCSHCKSMPHLSVVRCVRCWSENEKLEVQRAVAKARAEGKSVAGAAFAMLGAGRNKPQNENTIGQGRYRMRRDKMRPVFCLRHGMEGCQHAPMCKVLEIREDVGSIRKMIEELG